MATLLWRPNKDGSKTAYARHVWYENGKRREKRESLETSDPAVASRRLRGFIAKYDNKWGDRSISFEEAARDFLKIHCAGLKPNTVERYHVCLKQLRPAFAGKELKSIKKADLITFEARRRQDAGRYAGRKVSPASIRRDLLCLSSILTYAVLREWIEFNPVPAFLKLRKGSGLKESQPRRRYLSHDEEARLLRRLSISRRKAGKMRHDEVMRLAAVIVAIDTGLREAELLSLKWHDVQLHSRPSLAVRETKSGHPRRVPLFDRASKVLSELPIHPTSTYVFCKSNGKPYSSFRLGFQAAADAEGIDFITWHDLRRTCGVRLLRDHKRRIEEVSKWLGHQSIDITQRVYAFLDEEDLQDIVDADTKAREDQQLEKPSAEIVRLRRKGA